MKVKIIIWFVLLSWIFNKMIEVNYHHYDKNEEKYFHFAADVFKYVLEESPTSNECRSTNFIELNTQIMHHKTIEFCVSYVQIWSIWLNIPTLKRNVLFILYRLFKQKEYLPKKEFRDRIRLGTLNSDADEIHFIITTAAVSTKICQFEFRYAIQLVLIESARISAYQLLYLEEILY